MPEGGSPGCLPQHEPKGSIRFLSPWPPAYDSLSTAWLRFTHTLPDQVPSSYLPVTLKAASIQRRAEFIAGQLCARAALERAGFAPVLPGRNADRTPSWPSCCVGSISHSQDQALALIGHSGLWQSVGVDIEHRARVDLVDALWSEIAAENEIALMRFCFDSMIFERIFSVKEAAYKAIYPLTGVIFEFLDIKINAVSEDGRIELQLLRDLTPIWQAGRLITAHHLRIDETILSIAGIPRNE